MKKKLLLSSLDDGFTIFIGKPDKIIKSISEVLILNNYIVCPIDALELYKKKDILNKNDQYIYFIKNSEKLKQESLYEILETAIFYKKKVIIQLENIELISIEKISFLSLSILDFS